MKVSRFHRALDRWGPRLEDWPGRPRRQAQRLLARDPDCRAALQAAQSLEQQLGSALPRPDAAQADRLQRRLAAIPARYPQRTPRPAAAAQSPRPAMAGTAESLRRWLIGAAGLATVATLVGFLAGFHGLFVAPAEVDWALLAYGSAPNLISPTP